MTRAFIAVPLPESIRANLLELDRSEQGISWSFPDRWHITIQFFENADMGQLERLFCQIEAQEAVGSLGPRVSRLGKQILMVPVDGLSDVAEEVRTATASHGSHDQLPFVGHITLGRMKETDSAEIEGTPIEGVFRADRLLLVESRIDSGGHAHTVVDSRPLL
ncbi:MAG: hypothetical protein CNE88_06360 [Acidimicrobiales bacterium MED-G01]|nr:MAG: hypothetical protein CNE88_06360 [Acidimicrobiales bacterium MED-G01]